ncbi:MAG: di-heme enzyme [Fluviicoccus sp.]|uniref:methanobactin export MATE transporter MbnM n=1 Tax=Fluviicoccus sp. TaxID=2003552 RepID=UPI002716554A|nr:methanobactin export MATE transporter MbnM [Fluviicoccus sp.]MDO8328859.1 di-heme enzyme [Fluviicoccus sp.]
MLRHIARMLLPGLLGFGLSACNTGTTTTDPSLTASGWTWSLPAFFPTPKVPENNPLTADKVELGRHLFYEKRLSGNGTQSCGSCHLQAKAFTDGRRVAIGSTGDLHPRNSQPLHNVVYNATLTWANPALTRLEQQMLVPLFGESPVEMGINDSNKATVLDRIKADAAYAARFRAVWPADADPVTYEHVIQAIASFQRTLISGNSRYDQYLRRETVLTPGEERGMQLFNGEQAECFHCHGSFNFNDQIVHAGSRVVETPFHNTGLFNIGGTGEFPFPNRGVFETSGKPEDMGKFRAASLRNIALTAPYMHDGSLATLEEVLDFYAAGGRNITSGPEAGDGRRNPHKSDLIGLIKLTNQDKADIIAFLKTLTDEQFIHDPRFADPFAAP